MKYIRNFDNFQHNNLYGNLFEKREISSWQKTQKEIIKEYSINYYFILTFGTSIPVFYPFIESLIKNTGFNLKPSDIVLLTICGLATLFKENKSSINKLRLVIQEKGLIELLTKITNSLKSIKEIFSSLVKKFGKVIISFKDLFAYTALYVPFLSVLFDISLSDHLNLDTLPDLLNDITNKSGVIKSTIVGISLLGMKHFSKFIFTKIKDKYYQLINRNESIYL